MFEIVAVMFMVLGSKELDAIRITHDQFDGRPVKSVICAPVPKDI